MNLQVTLSANAGVSLEFRSARIWIDALHDTLVPGFSTLDNEMLLRMKQHTAFQNPDAVIYTHCHPDHYSRVLTEDAIRCWPDARLILPEPEFLQGEVLRGIAVDKAVGDVHIRFVRLPHEREEYAAVPHYGLLLQEDDFTVLVPGDCAVGNAALQNLTRGKHIDVALMNFPWVALRKGRDYIREELDWSHLLVYHLPFAADDAGGYRRAAKLSGDSMAGTKDIRCLKNFLQQEQV